MPAASSQERAGWIEGERQDRPAQAVNLLGAEETAQTFQAAGAGVVSTL
jgi:hypothetical protein